MFTEARQGDCVYSSGVPTTAEIATIAESALSMEFINAEAVFYMTALLMFISGGIVYIWMEETHPDFGTHEPPALDSERPPRTVSQD